MRIAYPETLTPESAQPKILGITRERVYCWIALAAIVGIAAALRFANLSALGYANHYYAAAVKAMLQSWHNFFYVAAEPGGSVSVDKPPLGLWLQVLSASIFGVNGFGLLLPQILAGIGSVVLLYHLVRRAFGAVAGLLAALVLAITPVVVATDRNNTIDSTLIFTLLLAAWAFLKATESGRMRFLLLGAGLVGVGFNIKMLEAYLPLPAFYGLYLLGSPERLGRKLGKLALATGLLLVISLSWAVAVDLTPPDQRPYVGSSGNNSEMSLITGYNGVERLLGMFGRRGGGAFGGQQRGGFPQPGTNGGPLPRNRAPGGFPPGGPPAGGFGRQQPFGQGAPQGFGGGFPGTGRPGALRLLIPPLSKEVSWLLPLGIMSAVLLAFRTRLRWPVLQDHQALVLWGGWLLTAGVFFSIAGFFHEYYLSTMGAPLAALVGIGVSGLWQLRRERPWQAFALLLAGAAATLGLQVYTARAFVQALVWLPLVLGLLAAGVILVVLASRLPRTAAAGFACITAALLLTPGAWSALTAEHSSDNQSLPSAYGGRSSGPANRGGLRINQALLGYLEANTQNNSYLMAVPSSMQGADYVLATGRPVLYMGGFMGEDKVLTPERLSRLVSDGELRYIYWDGRGGGGGIGGFGSQTEISAWVTAHCKLVPGFETATQNSGAPDGTTGPGSGGPNPGGGFFPGRGGMQVSLYDCDPGL